MNFLTAPHMETLEQIVSNDAKHMHIFRYEMETNHDRTISFSPCLVDVMPKAIDATFMIALQFIEFIYIQYFFANGTYFWSQRLG